MRYLKMSIALLLYSFSVMACNNPSQSAQQAQHDAASVNYEKGKNDTEATLAGGCFWCTEAVMERVKGVKTVVSGYAGGNIKNPTYDQVAGGKTEYAESIRIIYDSTQVDFKKLLEIFFTVAHDPTQLNRQGPDVGKQYRSAVFYHNTYQKQTLEEYIAKLEQSGMYEDDIVTQVNKLDRFYKAERYHQNFYDNHPNHAYITRYAVPKVEKLKQKYPDMIRQKYM